MAVCWPVKLIRRILPGVSTALLVARTAAHAQAPADSLLLTIAARAVDSRAQSARAWPGHTFAAEFVLCRGEASTLVVTPDSPPRSLGIATTVDLHTADGHRAYLFEGRLPGLPSTCFTLRYPLGDRRVLAFPLVDSLYSVAEPLLATVLALHHEEFHRFQQTRFQPTRAEVPAWRYDALEAGVTIPAALLGDAAFSHLATQERQLLANALQLPASDSLRSLLRTYLATRSTRMRLLPIALRGVEPHEERKEASAQLVGYTLGLLAIDGNVDRLTALVSRDLSATPAFDGPHQDPVKAWRTWHVYATGAAIGILLDRLGADWRRELQDGATYFALLAREVAFDDPAASDVMTVLPRRSREH